MNIYDKETGLLVEHNASRRTFLGTLLAGFVAVPFIASAIPEMDEDSTETMDASSAMPLVNPSAFNFADYQNTSGCPAPIDFTNLD